MLQLIRAGTPVADLQQLQAKRLRLTPAWFLPVAMVVVAATAWSLCGQLGSVVISLCQMQG